MNSASPPLLEARIEGVWDPRGRPLVQSLELEERGPGIISVIGDTGSGKTTLLRLLSGLIPHVYHGLVARARVRIGGLPPRKAVGVGRVFMIPNPPGAHFLTNTVDHELALAGVSLGASSQLERLRGRPVDRLSEGEKYFLLATIAVHTVGEEGLILVDEPQSNLDDSNLEWLFHKLTSLAENKNSLVVITGHGGQAIPGRRVLRLNPLIHRPLLEHPCLPPPNPSSHTVWLRECTISPPGGPVLIEGASLRVEPGEAVVITGPNGSGKTSLLKTLAGILRCKSGEARLPNRGVRLLPPPAYHVFTRDTVYGELAGPATRLGVDAGEVLRGIGLEEKTMQDPYTLSTGEARLLLLTRYVMEAPGLLLLDEPYRGLDSWGRGIVSRLLREYVDRGGIIVAAMLRPGPGEGLFDRAYDIRSGRLVEA